MAGFHGVPKLAEHAWRVRATTVALDNMVNQALQVCSAPMFDIQYLLESFRQVGLKTGNVIINLGVPSYIVDLSEQSRWA